MKRNYTYDHFVRILYQGHNATLKVFPNPRVEFISVQLSNDAIDPVIVELCNENGDTVSFQEMNPGINCKRMRFDVREEQSAVYMINIRTHKKAIAV